MKLWNFETLKLSILKLSILKLSIFFKKYHQNLLPGPLVSSPIGCVHEEELASRPPEQTQTSGAHGDGSQSVAIPGSPRVGPEGSLMENHHSSGVLDQIPGSNARRSQQGYHWV